ncbi:hypothetical protein HOG21_01815 [bacterium]|nr:hypothetical protein [bacterium]
MAKISGFQENKEILIDFSQLILSSKVVNAIPSFQFFIQLFLISSKSKPVFLAFSVNVKFITNHQVFSVQF